MEAASDLTVLHNVDSFPAGTDEIADAVRRFTKLTASNMPRLKNLKDLDFYYTEANRIEDDGDRMHRRMTAKLFDGSYKAMEVLRIQGVFEKMEESLDRMAAVARIVRTIWLRILISGSDICTCRTDHDHRAGLQLHQWLSRRGERYCYIRAQRRR